MKAANPSGVQHHQMESIEENKTADNHCSSTAESDDRRDSSTCGASHGTTHHPTHSHRPLQQDASASTSSLAPHEASVNSVATSDRAIASPSRGGQSSASTPTKLPGLDDTSRTVSPAENAILAKKRESHRAYLKSNSDFNRARIKYVSIEAELRLAEFWLEVMTKNLEDVGKRIEVHDWNFQKLTGQDESNVA
ncbi:unnamed protein product [Hyaloperonospora brassicae]|uniref:Uncharacterized protein n=1 Tax=Hyaloperonospora brassicae TaxID=162125 RepID=A0AAV0TPB8_HYABA|nr:unnamed protein product [Hyaloperonospora brassicae]